MPRVHAAHFAPPDPAGLAPACARAEPFLPLASCGRAHLREPQMHSLPAPPRSVHGRRARDARRAGQPAAALLAERAAAAAAPVLLPAAAAQRRQVLVSHRA
eukprot:6114074-Prymnesium_polylepis.1